MIVCGISTFIHAISQNHIPNYYGNIAVIVRTHRTAQLIARDIIKAARLDKSVVSATNRNLALCPRSFMINKREERGYWIDIYNEEALRVHPNMGIDRNYGSVVVDDAEAYVINNGDRRSDISSINMINLRDFRISFCNGKCFKVDFDCSSNLLDEFLAGYKVVCSD